MSDTQFFETRMGRTFYDSTMPAMVRALEGIAAALKALEPQPIPATMSATLEEAHEAGRVEGLRTLASATKKVLDEESVANLAGALRKGLTPAEEGEAAARRDAEALAAIAEFDQADTSGFMAERGVVPALNAARRLRATLADYVQPPEKLKPGEHDERD